MKTTILAIATLTTLGASANAALVNLSTYDEFAVWDDLTGAAATAAGINTGSFTTPTDWVLTSDGTTAATLAPQNGASSSAGALGKVVTTTTGGGYLASTGIYTGNFATTFFLEKTASLADVENVVFQIDLDNNSDWVAPTLSYNGGAQAISAVEMIISSEATSGAFGPATAQELLYQWDLSAIADNITDYTIEFGTGVHIPIPELSLASSEAFTVVSVPEPSSSTLITLGALGLLIRRKR
ncbi:MAG: PEP-CTERM sorting domain-containing protein [Akkermansiaceae bacterium]